MTASQWTPTEPFVPRRFLRGGHLQTVGGYLLKRNIQLPLAEERLIEVVPGVRVLCHCNWQPERTRALTLIAVHGLEGSSDSQYMRGLAQKALAAGMNAVRMNQRNCGGTDHLAPTLYHSGLSGDVAAVARNLITSESITRVALAGYSMGGNLVLKAAGEWDLNTWPQLQSVATVCPSMDLAASADELRRPANRIYQMYFVIKLKQRLARKAKLFPEKFHASSADGVSSVREFDDKVTAPFSGYRDADDYYDRAAAARVVGKIAVPALVLHALDDPFVRILPETRRVLLANPNITLAEPEHGGHCSFLAAPNGYDGAWSERQVVDFVGRAGK